MHEQPARAGVLSQMVTNSYNMYGRQFPSFSVLLHSLESEREREEEKRLFLFLLLHHLNPSSDGKRTRQIPLTNFEIASGLADRRSLKKVAGSLALLLYSPRLLL